VSPLWLFALVVLPVLDGFYRLLFVVASRWWSSRRPQGSRPRRYLVLVPARGEGEAVLPTLRSLAAGGTATEVSVVLVLDGEDPVAASAAAGLGVRAVCKLPPGPSKAAALAWAAEHLTEELASADALFVLDVGSTVSERFFDRLLWVPGADGVQAFLVGTGRGPGASAALSERLAQRHEDRGREALGWSVRLRGTGFALRPALFRAVVSRLRTQIEDTEMSLLLVAAGARLAMGPEDALVFDVKPELLADAARQRARWLAGQLALPVRQAGAWLRLVGRRPLEGLAFMAEVGGRPLSLSVPLRLAVGAALAVSARGALGPAAILAAVCVLSAAGDVVLHVAAGGFSVRSGLGLVTSWARAVVLLPRALAGWMRGRGSGSGTGGR
jgi:hypothetical protein